MTRPLHIFTLGEFALAGPLGAIDVQLPSIARSLLVVLARARAPLTREELADRWWPDAEPQRSRASLSTTLWTLRSTLRDPLQGDPLHTTRDRVALAAGIDVTIDVDRFEAAIEQGDDAAAEGWYRGAYLRDIFEDAVIAERERLAALYEAVLTRLLNDDPAPDPDRARRLIAADPYAETAYRVLVDAALAEGSNAAARAWMRRARSAFAEIGATPEFFGDTPYRGLDALDGGARKTNLSSEVTSFFGRHADVRTVDESLADARIVTILGAGGSGKTRLAREVAARALGVRHSSAWFVELAPFEGEGAVEAAIAATLGLREDARTRADVIAEALRDSDALLILDNCEHLIDEAASVAARLIRDAPLVRILATSREALRVEAEAIVPLDGLAHADAVDLFLARARSADRRLTIDEDALDQARRIARALDGLPLAIELAAARVRIDGLHAIAADALQVVHGAVGPRDRTQRSQTIGASIAWSVDRLDPAARTLFARLGTFAGTFEAGDAAALDLDTSGALDRLLDRSLVVRRDPFDVGLRMLSPVRADARGRLESDPQRDAVLDAHAERIRTRTLELLALCGGEAGAGAEARLDMLTADIDVALERLFSWSDPGTAVDLVCALSSHWAARGARFAAEHWLARAEARASDDRRRGDIFYARCRFAHDGADGTRMLQLGEAARDAYARAGVRGGEARAWNVIGSALIDLQRRDEARGALARSLELQREVGDEFGISIALINLGNVAAESGDLEAALQAYDECAPILDRVSTTQARIKVQNNIAYVRMKLGDRSGSLQATSRAMTLAETSANAAMIAFAASNAAIRFAIHGDYERAAPLARRVGELDAAPERYVGYALIALALAAHARGNEPQTRRLSSAARLIERTHGTFEDEESALLMPLPGAADDAIDRDVRAARALLIAPNPTLRGVDEARVGGERRDER